MFDKNYIIWLDLITKSEEVAWQNVSEYLIVGYIKMIKNWFDPTAGSLNDKVFIN